MVAPPPKAVAPAHTVATVHAVDVVHGPFAGLGVVHQLSHAGTLVAAQATTPEGLDAHRFAGVPLEAPEPAALQPPPSDALDVLGGSVPYDVEAHGTAYSPAAPDLLHQQRRGVPAAFVADLGVGLLPHGLVVHHAHVALADLLLLATPQHLLHGGRRVLPRHLLGAQVAPERLAAGFVVPLLPTVTTGADHRLVVIREQLSDLRLLLLVRADLHGELLGDEGHHGTLVVHASHAQHVAPGVVLHVQVRVVVDEHVDDGDLATLRSDVCRRVAAVAVLDVGVGAVGQQRFQHAHVPQRRSLMHGGVALHVTQVQLTLAPAHQLHQLRVVGSGSQVQRRTASVVAK